MKREPEQKKPKTPLWTAVRLGALVLIGVFMVHYAITTLDQIAQVRRETEYYQARIRNEMYVQEEIEREAYFSKSPEFVERIARQHLNLVHPDELIFRFED
ncbi:MAG: septum formation initiator family protein [Defluviitaleaceae bacterium]|nr:septum formation initiator family protein [Defluviitaleaceae bacterium]